MAGHGKHPICDSNPGIQVAGRGRGNGRETFIFPNKGKGKGKNSKNSVQDNQNISATRDSTGTVKRPPFKCTICEGKHGNLILCKELLKYLPFGNNQKPIPPSICPQCMGTEFSSSNQCNHKNNKYYKHTLRPANNRNILLCTECPKHVPALEYLRKHHDPSQG